MLIDVGEVWMVRRCRRCAPLTQNRSAGSQAAKLLLSSFPRDISTISKVSLAGTLLLHNFKLTGPTIGFQVSIATKTMSAQKGSTTLR
jgi:hypothetical protein